MKHMFWKRALSAVVSTVVLAASMPAVIAEEEVKPSGELISLDYEGEKAEYAWKTGGPVTVEATDEEKGQSMCLGSTGANTKVRYNFEGQPSEGILNVRFDYKTVFEGETAPLIYLSFFNGQLETYNNANVPYLFESLFINNTFSFMSGSDGWTKAPEIKDVENGKWYTIDIWMDLTKRKMTYLIDGELFGTTGLSDNMPEVAGMFFLFEGIEGARNYIDNYTVTKMTEKEALEYAKQGGVTPAELAQEVEVIVETGQLGNIYYTKGVQSLSLKLRNKTEQEQKLTMKYSLTNEGRKGAEETKEVFLAPLEERSETIELHGDRFGYYDLQTDVYRADGSLMGTLPQIKYSVVNAPPEGVHNEKLGTNVKIRPHQVKLDDMMANFKLAERIGMSLYRVEVAMGQYDQKHAPGQTGLGPEHQELFKFIKEKGITPTMTLGFGEPLNPEYNKSLNEYALALMDDPMVNSVTNQYALLNEPDLASRPYTVERYVEVLKDMYAEVKAAHPEVHIWGPATAGRTNEWVKSFFRLGGGENVDGIDVHGYTLASTPEGGGSIEALQELHQIMEENGCGDLPIYYSEHGWSSVGENRYADEYQQGYYNVRLLILNDYYDLVDQLASYTVNNYGLNNEREMRFGMLKAYNDVIPYEAKPLYLTYGNYNALMIGAEFIDGIELSSDAYAYRYKLADGRDCVVTWSISGMAQQAIKLDAESVEMYDSYGNAETLYGIDGNFSLSLTEEPIYLVGNFTTAEKGEIKFIANKNKSFIVEKDCADVIIEKTFDGEVEVVPDLPDNLTVEENNGFVEGRAKVIVRSKAKNTDREKAVVYVKKDGKTVYKTELFTEYGDAVEIELYSKPYDANQLNHWQTVLEFKSNTYADPNSGVIKIKEPAVLADSMKEIKIPEILPGETKAVKINLPQSLNYQTFNLKADIEMEIGGTIPIEQSVSSDACLYANEKPVIDGVLGRGEWNKKARMRMRDKGVAGSQYVTLLTNDVPYGGDSDLSADLYTMWDEENFYFALEVTDDVNTYDKEGGIYWASDGVQICMAEFRGSKEVMGFGLGMVGEEKVIELEVTPTQLYAGPIEADMVVTRHEEEKLTVYEVCVPWESVYPVMNYRPRRDAPMAFSILINDHDGTGRHGYLEYGSGVGKGGKNSVIFRDIFMLGKVR